MAIKKVVEIGAKVGQAVKEIKELANELLEAERQAQALNQEIEDTTDSGKKGFKGLSGAIGIAKTALNALGTALKALGIGLLLAAFAALTNIVSQNQKVIDFAKTSMTAFNIVVNNLVNFITKNIGNVKKFFNELLTNPKDKIKEIGEFLTKYLLNNLVKTLEATKLLGDAFKLLFSGDLGGAWDKATASASKFLDAVTGVDDSAKKLKDSLADVWDEADKITKLQNNARLSRAELQGLVEMYDRLAEQQRQIRDNENLTIQERIDANNKLADILKQQEKAQLALASAIVASAEAEYNLNKNIDNQVALIEARNEAEGVRAQIAGFVSEQMTNQVALEKELLEYNQLAIEGMNQRELIGQQLYSSLEKDSIKRLENERENLVLEGDLEDERLKKKVESLQKGTLAYQEANQEYLTFIEEQGLKIVEKENEIALAKEEREREVLQSVIDNEMLSFETRYQALDAFNQAVLNSTQLSEYEQTKLIDQQSKKRTELVNKEKEAKLKLFDAMVNAGDAMAQAVGEQTALGKALAVASALINTYKGIANEMGTTTVTPYEIALKVLNVATVAAIGFKSVKDILSVKVPNDKGGGSAGSAPQAQPPNFNMVGQSGTNQLAQTIAGQEQEPIKAYVVAKDVTNQQNLDLNIRRTASI